MTIEEIFKRLDEETKANIKIVSMKNWPEGKFDPTEFSEEDSTIYVREDYSIKDDPLCWIVHEKVHFQLFKKGEKDDGKDYPYNYIEKVAYHTQFKALKEKGMTFIEFLNQAPNKKKYKNILREYWINSTN